VAAVQEQARAAEPEVGAAVEQQAHQPAAAQPDDQARHDQRG
jgi:hypothetical protein